MWAKKESEGLDMILIKCVIIFFILWISCIMCLLFPFKSLRQYMGLLKSEKKSMNGAEIK